MREYQRRLSVFESVPGTGSIVSIGVSKLWIELLGVTVMYPCCYMYNGFLWTALNFYCIYMV